MKTATKTKPKPAAKARPSALLGADGMPLISMAHPAKQSPKITSRAVKVGNLGMGPGRDFTASTTVAGEDVKLTAPGKQHIHPVGYRILLRDWLFNRTTAGGIALPDEVLDAQEHLNFIGQVMELGPDCYKQGVSKAASLTPWCKQGDWVLFGKYAGQKVKIKSTGEIYRFVNDVDVLAVAEKPDDLKVYLS